MQSYLYPLIEIPSVDAYFDAKSNSGYQTATSTYSWTHVCAGNNRFLAVDVAVLSVPGTTVTGITYNGVALTFIGAKSTVSGAGRVECWGLIAPAAGSHTIAVTLSASAASAGLAESYYGVNQTVPTEAFNSAQATNVGAADATVTITSVADRCLVRGVLATDDTVVTANQIGRNNVTGALGSGADEDTQFVTPAGTATISYTGVGALITWAIAGYAIRPISASGTATYAATIAGTVGAATASFAVTFAKPTYTGSINGTVGAVTAGFSATFTQPTFATTISATIGPATAAFGATFVKPTFTASIVAIVGAATFSVVATFVTPPDVITGGGEVGEWISTKRKRSKKKGREEEKVKRLPDDAETIATAVLLLW